MIKKQLQIVYHFFFWIASDMYKVSRVDFQKLIDYNTNRK